MYHKITELIKATKTRQMTIAQLMLEQECTYSKETKETVLLRMKQQLAVMHEAASKGSAGNGVSSRTGLTGHQAAISWPHTAVRVKVCQEIRS